MFIIIKEKKDEVNTKRLFGLLIKKVWCYKIVEQHSFLFYNFFCYKIRSSLCRSISHVLTFSFVYCDVDLYEPTLVCLEGFYPLVTKGGVIILDDYGAFPGANKAIDKYFKDKDIVIKKLSYSNSISFVEKS